MALIVVKSYTKINSHTYCVDFIRASKNKNRVKCYNLQNDVDVL